MKSRRVRVLHVIDSLNLGGAHIDFGKITGSALLGWPALLGGEHNPLSLERWIEPVVALGSASFVGARAWYENHLLEGLLMLVSIGVATAGWWTARVFYYDGARAEARLLGWKERYAGLHQLIYEKYRVDEFYRATVVRAFVGISRACAPAPNPRPLCRGRLPTAQRRTVWGRTSPNINVGKARASRATHCLGR